MSTLSISCPYCSCEIQLTDAVLTSKVRQALLEEMQPELEKQRRALAEERKQVQDIQRETATAIQKGIDAGLNVVQKQARIDAEDNIASEQLETKAKIESLAAAIKEKNEIEFGLRKEKLDLVRKIEEQDLITQRAVDSSISSAKLDFENRLRLKESEQKVREDSLKKKVDELQSKLEQKSSQVQGEVLELDIEETLRIAYPLDVIEPVAKGTRGGDCIQRVVSPTGAVVGVILWECKNTKNFSEVWIQKLKDDLIPAKADVGFIVSIVLPKDLVMFGQVNGIWVTSYACFKQFSGLMRGLLLRVATERNIQVGKQSKAELLYEFVTGSEFRQRVEAIAGPFIEMQTLHEKEKLAMSRIWSAREKQLQRILDSISGLAGSIEGLTGKSLGIEALELKSLDEGSALKDT